MAGGAAAPPSDPAGLGALAHHDGSPRYLRQHGHELGCRVDVRVRVAHELRADEVHVRTVVDGEPSYRRLLPVEAEGDDGATWWAGSFTLDNPVVHYRFLLLGGAAGYRWLDGAGVHPHDIADHTDFRVSAFAPPPTWLAGTVLYQVMPDRFARSDRGYAVPEWARVEDWDAPLAEDWRTGVRQFFGGDLTGLRDRLDHLVSLGVNAVYLTPFFPAESMHRYNATSFDHVDPALGGDAALAELVAAAHERGIRIIGDLTTNHSGSGHEWFRAGAADLGSAEAGYYYFGDDADDYVAWYGVRDLPKLNWRSTALRDRLVRGPGSVVDRWLREPFHLDGWRIDVANMTGRHREDDHNRSVARDVRATMASAGGERWLVAEHCYDASADLAGDGWHGTMAYSWFTRPVCCWLRGEAETGLMGLPAPPPRLDAAAVVAGIRALAAGVPWSAFTASMTLLDSHDTARFRTVAGDRDRHVVGLAFLMAFPGVPMVFAGDEVGVEGADSDRARRPFPWDASVWDAELLDAHRALIALRRAEPALQTGGLRWLHAADDAITFVREGEHDSVLVHLTRAAGEPVRLPLGHLGGRLGERLHGSDDARLDGDAVVLPGGGPAAHFWRVARRGGDIG